jgi:hypothetical protein
VAERTHSRGKFGQAAKDLTPIHRTAGTSDDVDGSAAGGGLVNDHLWSIVLSPGKDIDLPSSLGKSTAYFADIHVHTTRFFAAQRSQWRRVNAQHRDTWFHNNLIY